jgi:hypothetical protein
MHNIRETILAFMIVLRKTHWALEQDRPGRPGALGQAGR